MNHTDLVERLRKIVDLEDSSYIVDCCGEAADCLETLLSRMAALLPYAQHLNEMSDGQCCKSYYGMGCDCGLDTALARDD